MTHQLIKSIHVRQLFGMYTYDIPANGHFDDAAILYGDNGLGKSTLLRLAFHMLSPAETAGHRTALHSTAFELFEVRLASGIRLRAERNKAQSTALHLTIQKGDTQLVEWDYKPEEKHTETSVTERLLRQIQLISSGSPAKKHAPEKAVGKEAYLKELRKHAPVVFILNADRRLDSDSVPDPDDEVELRRVMHYREPKRIQDLAVRSREIALTQALTRATHWINRQVFQGANQGSTNVHAVYSNVLKQLSSGTKKRGNAQRIDTEALIVRLVELQKKSAQHAQYELSVPLKTDDFVEALKSRSSAKRDMASKLLLPYVESLEGRLAAIDQVYVIVDRFVTTVNVFLYDKEMTFRPSTGFGIVNRLGVELPPAYLSSGEQQLLLLLCYVLTARDTPSVFMIDEPELSLNVKWQRQLVQALLDLTDRTKTQFLLASHSIELLTQHRTRVVRLAADGEQ